MGPIPNGDSAGVSSNGCSGTGAVVPPGCWTVGLINARHKYLTAETFGFKINANGVSMKKKQVWILEPFGSSQVGGGGVALRSHLNRYLAVDQFGNVTCDSEDKDECGPAAKFEISIADDGSGRWALRNASRGYYVGAMADKLVCEAKVPGEAELWTVHLAARPQVNLRSVGRKRFAHLSENGEEIQMDANVAWGPDTLFTLEFRPEALKYAIHACNDKYLSKEGKLVAQVSQDCLYSVEFHQGCLAVRDAQGLYLGPIGSRAALRTRSSAVTKDELFQLEDSLPQASFFAGLNARYVSVKQGIDVTANQDEVSDFETFQLEFDCTTKRWYIRTMQDKYWTLETGGGIQAVGDKKSSNALFEFSWGDKGSVSFRANNGKYVTTKKSGQLYANADGSEEDNAKFYFELANRPVLVLKCEQGFVGSKAGGEITLECNKATYDTILVEKGQKGLVYFQGKNGKYWRASTGNLTCDGDQPTEGFYLELMEPSRMRIKTADASFLVAAKNGAFTVGSKDPENATLWEY